MCLLLFEKEIRVMAFEGVVVDLLQRNTAVVSNSVYGVERQIKEINRTLQFIDIQLKNLNEQLVKINHDDITENM